MTVLDLVDGDDQEPPPPKAPRGLKAAGRRLWDSFTAEFVFDAAGLVLLEAAARSSDLEARCQRAVDAAKSLSVKGSRFNLVELPEAGTLLKARAQTAALIKQLQLPDSEEEKQRKSESVSDAARRAARARWDRHRFG